MSKSPPSRSELLHLRLVCLQSSTEIARKQAKAARRNRWTQEDFDRASRDADDLIARLRFDDDPVPGPIPQTTRTKQTHD